MNNSKQLGIFIILGLLLASSALAACEQRKVKTNQEIRNTVVKLVSGTGSCSGEQVNSTSGHKYILTASHCKGLANKQGYITVLDENNRKYAQKVISEDLQSDLMLLEGIPALPALDIAPYAYKHERVRTFTHGSGYDTYITEGVLIQYTEVKAALNPIFDKKDEAACKMPKNKIIEVDTFFGLVKVCILDTRQMATTAMIVPGSSGGAVVDKQGDLVGVVSAGDSRNFGYLVRLKDIKRYMKGL